jgi:hypothetical protein
LYGGYNPALVWNDLLALGDYETDYNQLLDINTLETLFFPLSSTAEPGASTAFDLSGLFGGLDASSLDFGALFGGFDPAATSAEFADLLEGLTAAWVPDVAATSVLTAI